MSPARGKELGDLESQIDEIYRQPLYAFVEARNALAGRRRFASDKEGAARVKSLAKPSASAWVVNQLHWNARTELQAFFDAANQVRTAQQEGAAAEELREATRKRREALLVVNRRSESLLVEAGHGAPPSAMRRVTGTLEALAFRLATGEKQPLGRLSEDLEPPGLDALQGLSPAATGHSSKTKAAAAPAGEKASAKSLAQAEAAAARGRRREEETKTEAAAAQERLAAAKAELDEARRRFEHAQEREVKAAAAAAGAAADAESAESERAGVEQALIEARRTLGQE